MKKIKEIFSKNTKVIIAFIVGIIISGTTVYAATTLLSQSVYYNNSTSGATSTNVQGAIDELYTKANNMWCKSGYEKTDITGGYKCTPPPANFNEATSWEDIVASAQAGNLIANVGDTKTVDLGTFGTHTLRIANTTTPAECSTTGFSQTACGLVLEFADIITTHNMNSTNTNVGGWPASSMRTYVNSDIYNALPTALKNAIIDTTVVSGHGKTSGETNFTSTDKLYLLSRREVWNYTGENDTAQGQTRQLDYYAGQNVTTSSYSGAKKNNGSNSIWWLRSASSSNTAYFTGVYSSGSNTNYNASLTYGVSPAFRLR